VISPSDVIEIIGGELKGNDQLRISGINEIHKVDRGDITFVDHPKYYERALNSKASLIIIDNEASFDEQSKVIIVHPKPFDAYNQLVNQFYQFQSSSQLVSESATIGEGTVIQPNAFIGNNVTIGKNCLINPNATVYDNVIIGDNVIVHANTVIGSDAFYYKKKDTGYDKLLSCGNVIIHNNVEIGSGCTIDKGVSGDTIIGEGTKIDNQVHIAHGTTVGRNCLFAAQTTIAGKTTIEDDVTIWGQVGVNSNVTIGKGAVIMAQSGVTTSLDGGKTYFGMPAQEARQQMKQQVYLRKLPELFENLKK
jgi:UDP-3-O-[3-hydroxymyristoyl] glucosamine N-acyltransferase